MINSIKHILRLIKIALVLYRNGALFILHDLRIALPLYNFLRLIPFQETGKRKGERLAKALEDLGPVFIKFGQTLATRSDIIGEEMAKDLSMLQDKLPPSIDVWVEKEIEKELHGKISTLFRSFDNKAVAAASIAEVFKAVTPDGKIVAVKVLRQGVEEQFARDIELFFWLAHIIEKHLPFAKRLRPVDVVKTFARCVSIEMDLRLEAAAASELKDNLENDDGVYIPEVDWARTARRVLTLEWIDGIQIHDTKRLVKAGFNLKKLCANFATLFFNQAYRDGFFHADMHPGNVLVDKQGRIVFIDFGIMGRLDKKSRVFIAEILHGFLKRDYMAVAKIHFAAGYVSHQYSIADFAQACRSIGEPIVGLPSNEMSVAKLLAHLFQVTKDFEMQTQPQLLLIQKTTVLVEGVGSKLDPSVNIWKLAEPWIEQWANQNIGFDAKIVDASSDIIEFLRYDLPNYLKNYTPKQEAENNATNDRNYGLFSLIVVGIIAATIAAVIACQ